MEIAPSLRSVLDLVHQRDLPFSTFFVGKPKAPRGVKEIDPKEITIPGKTELRLQCKITGHPIPKIKWLRDGNEIKVRKGVIVAQDASGGATLVIEKAQVRQNALYDILR